MFGSFEDHTSHLVITLDANKSWDSQRHEVVFPADIPVVLGLPRDEFKRRGKGQLNIRIAEKGEPSFDATVKVETIDLTVALKSGTGLTVEFWNPDDPVQRQRFIQDIRGNWVKTAPVL